MIHEMEQMRVLFLADAVFEDLPGGSRVAARELAYGLASRGHEITFLVGRQTPDGADIEDRGPIRIVRYSGAGNGADFVRKGREACEKLCSKQSFDLVHTHFAYASVGPLGAVPKNVPRVRTFHGPWDEEGWLEESRTSKPISLLKAAVKRKIRQRIEQNSLRGSVRILTLSECFAQMAQARYGIAPDRIQVIPGGTDVKRFCIPKDKSAVRKQLGLPTDRRILLTIRRLAPRMGLDNLVKGMAEVVKKYPDVLLLIGGKGPERDRLGSIVKEHALESNVRLLGFIPDDNLAAHYQAADLFVLPTVALEGFGLVIPEALACGVPVIGTPVGAIPEILSKIDPRLISRGTDAMSLAAAILQFFEEDWTKNLAPDQIRSRVLEYYTWERHADSIEAAYREIKGKGTAKV